MKTFLVIATFIMIMTGLVENTLCFQAEPVDLKLLQRLFVAEFDKDFQFTKGELKIHSIDSEKHQYWLAQVKPKHTGFFTIKYSYKFADKFYAEGETEMKIAVGGKDCSRYPQIVREIGYFCLGDTIVIPIRLHKFSKHTFNLESRYEKPENIEESRKNYYNFYHDRTNTDKVTNPLEENLKYLGKSREDNLKRSGGGTFTYFAVFEAKSKGKFNIALSVEGKEANNFSLRSTPVIIINRGTPITSLVPKETATYYIKGRTYSSAYTNSFESHLLILQPGDIIAEPFYFLVEKVWWEDKSVVKEASVRTINPIPVIRKQMFAIKTTDGFNDWVNDYLSN